MTSFVIDASALFEVVVGRAPARDLWRRALTSRGSAPELIDLEALNTIRRLRRGGDLQPEDADEAIRALAEMLDVPLLTCDARLGRTHGHGADVIVYSRS